MESFIEVIIQTVLAFFGILFVARILGRQQVSQLTFYEYVNGITFGSIAGNLATNLNENTYLQLMSLILFGILTGIVSYISLKKRTFRKVVEGEPVLVIQNGKLLENKLKKLRYSIDELNLLLRQRGIYSPENVEYGILEVNGNISIILKKDKQTVTREDLNIKGSEDTLYTEIIIGGQLVYENLKKRNLTGKELMEKLEKFKVNHINEVMYAAIDGNGKMYVDKYCDKLNNKIDLSENNSNT